MRSVILKRKSNNQFVIIIEADGYRREYVEGNFETAKARAIRLKLILGIK
ncbi:hypothetical protein [Pelosinus propionicus]|uniref:Uncharacterized protein n=1 Tax=Pelosinus propionicus DSM 13327 TaxID=1123291 RepID=A0A1I4N7Q1_9FIRM|nr:hypothetical protein [Pelosinus propionicus]SFM11584.1 hypothetical protein SAMN04490355_104215 [Pelosinus propionicus DSM 13327]